MQPTEGFSVPRRSLDVEDYIDIMRRHKGWIFGPFLLTLVASVVGVYLWPDSYVSRAMVKVVPQQVPQNMVQSAVNQEMTDRINSMSQTILSRTVLTTIINTFGLYPRERSRKPLEDVIEDMKRKIDILPVGTMGSGSRQVPAFAVQFTYEDRYLAQKVVQDLVSRFIDENIRNRSNASFQTTQFLKDQVDQAKRELDEIESKLTDFRVQNNGRLPDQVDANMRQLQALQANVTYYSNAISRAQQEKLQLETNIRIFRDQQAALTKEPPPEQTRMQQQKSAQLAEVEREIQNWENQLSVLRQHYKETYPDVQTAMRRLAAAQGRREEVLKEENASQPDLEPTRPVVLSAQVQRELRDLEASMRRAQSTVESKDVEIAEYSRELKRANDAIKTYQSRIETVPLGERQYGDLLRERDLSKEKYMKLDETLSKAQIAQDMEGRKQGETLELLDPASLPQNPTEPKRPMVISVAAGMGLLLGIVIAGARELKDTSLKNLKDVRAYTQMAILGSVPLLENDFVVRRRRRLAWLGWTAACLAACITMTGSVVYYYVTKT
jgi:polysaccharide chain length determinant protein (PEP-CTERM system associated)